MIDLGGLVALVGLRKVLYDLWCGLVKLLLGVCVEMSSLVSDCVYRSGTAQCAHRSEGNQKLEPDMTI